MKPILLLLFAATAACVGALLPLISRARSKRLLLNAVRRASSDAPDGIGISVLCSGVTDAAQIENLLSPEYSRYEVIVVLDARRGGRFELSPSEQLLYDRRSGEGRIVRGADAMRYSIWKDDVISFRDTPLAEVLETLSRWYDVRFETDGQPDRPISYTFATDNTLLDNVLREMELISPVRFERTKTEIKVSFR